MHKIIFQGRIVKFSGPILLVIILRNLLDLYMKGLMLVLVYTDFRVPLHQPGKLTLSGSNPGPLGERQRCFGLLVNYFQVS